MGPPMPGGIIAECLQVFSIPIQASGGLWGFQPENPKEMTKSLLGILTMEVPLQELLSFVVLSFS